MTQIDDFVVARNDVVKALLKEGYSEKALVGISDATLHNNYGHGINIPEANALANLFLTRYTLAIDDKERERVQSLGSGRLEVHRIQSKRSRIGEALLNSFYAADPQGPQPFKDTVQDIERLVTLLEKVIDKPLYKRKWEREEKEHLERFPDWYRPPNGRER